MCVCRGSPAAGLVSEGSGCVCVLGARLQQAWLAREAANLFWVVCHACGCCAVRGVRSGAAGHPRMQVACIGTQATRPRPGKPPSEANPTFLPPGARSTSRPPTFWGSATTPPLPRPRAPRWSGTALGRAGPGASTAPLTCTCRSGGAGAGVPCVLLFVCVRLRVRVRGDVLSLPCWQGAALVKNLFLCWNEGEGVLITPAPAPSHDSRNRPSPPKFASLSKTWRPSWARRRPSFTHTTSPPSPA